MKIFSSTTAHINAVPGIINNLKGRNTVRNSMKYTKICRIIGSKEKKNEVKSHNVVHKKNVVVYVDQGSTNTRKYYYLTGFCFFVLRFSSFAMMLLIHFRCSFAVIGFMLHRFQRYASEVCCIRYVYILLMCDSSIKHVWLSLSTVFTFIILLHTLFLFPRN